MDRIFGALALLRAGLGRLATDTEAIAKFVGALLVLATAVVLTLHFIHVYMDPHIPDIWPSFEPSGFPSVPSA